MRTPPTADHASITEKTSVSIRLVIALAVGCIAVTGSYTALWWKIDSIDTGIAGLSKTVCELSDDNAANAVNHAVFKADIDSLRDDMNRLDGDPRAMKLWPEIGPFVDALTRIEPGKPDRKDIQ